MTNWSQIYEIKIKVRIPYLIMSKVIDVYIDNRMKIFTLQFNYYLL
jgi:hypothetical protein